MNLPVLDDQALRATHATSPGGKQGLVIPQCAPHGQHVFGPHALLDNPADKLVEPCRAAGSTALCAGADVPFGADHAS